MKAIGFERYGDPTAVLSLVDVPEPAITTGDGLLVRVVAAGLNPADWHLVRGVPYLARASMGLRPRTTGLGLDVAGVVEATGDAATGLVPGDRVFGIVGPAPGTSHMRLGAVAEQVVVRARDVVRLPPGSSFEEGAAVGVAGSTALRGLRETAGVRAGSRVLIHGASGGVGTFAVQIGVADGADVIGVCSTSKTAMVTELGARRVVDYTREDTTALDEVVDVVLDNVGNHPPRRWRRVLAPGGVYVANFGRKHHRVVGPLGRLAAVAALDRASSRHFRVLPTRTGTDELTVLRDMLANGTVRPVIGHTVDLPDAPAAMQLIADGHARGKVVVRVQGA